MFRKLISSESAQFNWPRGILTTDWNINKKRVIVNFPCFTVNWNNQIVKTLRQRVFLVNPNVLQKMVIFYQWRKSRWFILTGHSMVIPYFISLGNCWITGSEINNISICQNHCYIAEEPLTYCIEHQMLREQCLSFTPPNKCHWDLARSLNITHGLKFSRAKCISVKRGKLEKR